MLRDRSFHPSKACRKIQILQFFFLFFLSLETESNNELSNSLVGYGTQPSCGQLSLILRMLTMYLWKCLNGILAYVGQYISEQGGQQVAGQTDIVDHPPQILVASAYLTFCLWGFLQLHYHVRNDPHVVLHFSEVINGQEGQNLSFYKNKFYINC